MKTFSKLKEEIDRFKNTKDVVKGVFSGKGIGEIRQDVQSGKINIGKFKKLTSSKEIQDIPLKVLQGLLQDTSKMVDSAQTKVNNTLNK